MIYLLLVGAVIGSIIGSLVTSSVTGANPLPAIIIGAAMGFSLSLSLAVYQNSVKEK